MKKKKKSGPPSAPPPPSAPKAVAKKKKVRVARANTNVLVLQLGTLAEESSMATGDPYYCKNSSCKAVLSTASKLEKAKDDTMTWKW